MKSIVQIIEKAPYNNKIALVELLLVVTWIGMTKRPTEIRIFRKHFGAMALECSTNTLNRLFLKFQNTLQQSPRWLSVGSGIYLKSRKNFILYLYYHIYIVAFSFFPVLFFSEGKNVQMVEKKLATKKRSCQSFTFTGQTCSMQHLFKRPTWNHFCC